MKKKKLFTTLFIVGAILLSFSSCKDDENVTASAASLTATAGDEAQASTINDQILSEVDTYVSANAQLVKPMFTGAVTSVPDITIGKTETTLTGALKKIKEDVEWVIFVSA